MFFAMFSVVSPASSLHVQRGGEADETSECRSLGFLPGFPIFSLRGRSWSVGFRLRSCCSRCRSACRARLSSRDAVSVDCLVSYFPLCGRCAIVGCLRTASAFPAFALVVLVGPVAVF